MRTILTTLKNAVNQHKKVFIASLVLAIGLVTAVSIFAADGFETSTEQTATVGSVETVTVTAPAVSQAQIDKLKSQRDKAQQAVENAKQNLAQAKKNGKKEAINNAQKKLDQAQKNLQQAKDNLAIANGKNDQKKKDDAKKKKDKEKEKKKKDKDKKKKDKDKKKPKPDKEKQKPGKKSAVKVTVLLEREGKKPSKLAKVRLSISPKCKAGQKRTNKDGVASFVGCKNGKHTVTVVPPKGYAVVGQPKKTVTLKGCGCKKMSFKLKKIAVAAQVTPTPTVSASPSAAPTAGPSATSGPSGPSNPPDGSQPNGTQGGGSDVAGAGTLPKTGQAGLIVFLTFLAASAVYYGGRKYLHKRNR